MSYRKQGSRQYQAHRPYRRFLSASYLSSNQQAKFREEWELGMAAAEEQIKRLKEEGWNVETNRTFMGDPKKLSATAPDGFEVATVPITNWGSEEIVFLAFRPKMAPVVPPIQTQTTAAQTTTT